MDDRNSAIIYGVPKVAYGMDGCTPFPMCIRSWAEYFGIPMDYAQAMAESGAAFRLVWDTSCWNGGNVDAVHAFDAPDKMFACGIRAMGKSMRMLERTPEMKKEDFICFFKEEIDSGRPVIALGIIGPPEACVITGYRNGGDTLLGWNVFQEYPENQASVQFDPCGYFITQSWWDDSDTLALIAIGGERIPAFTPKEVLQNAAEVLSGRMCGSYAKGISAYDAWKNAILCDRDFPPDAVFPLLGERMMCHGDAMDCLTDGRLHGAKYLRRLSEAYPRYADKLNAAAREFDKITEIIHREMIPVLGGWERGEHQIRRLAEPANRRIFATQIERMKAHDERALICLRELAEVF